MAYIQRSKAFKSKKSAKASAEVAVAILVKAGSTRFWSVLVEGSGRRWKWTAFTEVDGGDVRVIPIITESGVKYACRTSVAASDEIGLGNSASVSIESLYKLYDDPDSAVKSVADRAISLIGVLQLKVAALKS